MNELNNDWVLWGSFIVLGLTIVTFVAYAVKAFLSMRKKQD
jgi:hypothetical protein